MLGFFFKVLIENSKQSCTFALPKKWGVPKLKN